jgi:hypothetical protein
MSEVATTTQTAPDSSGANVLTPPPQAAPAAPASTEIHPAASWRDSLPDDIKGDPSLRPIQDVSALAKSYVNAQKAIGAEKVVIPGKHSTEADWQNFYRKMGVPESADKYDVTAPDQAKIDPAFFGEFKKAAHGAGVLPAQAQKLFNWYYEQSTKAVQAHEDQALGARSQEIEAFAKELGQNFEPTLNRARTAVQALAPKELQDTLLQAKLHNHPQVVKFFESLYGFLKEDQIKGQGSTTLGTSPEEASQKIDAIMRDSKHPYFDKGHAGHLEAVKEMENLFKLRLGGAA